MTFDPFGILLKRQYKISNLHNKPWHIKTAHYYLSFLFLTLLNPLFSESVGKEVIQLYGNFNGGCTL